MQYLTRNGRKAASFVFLVAVTLIAFACGHPEEVEKKEEPEEIDPRLFCGQWRNVYLKLQMNTYKDSDSAFTFEVTEKDWEKKMNIRPIRTYFWADNTYNSMHYDLKDSLFYNPFGRWYLKKDSLIMVDMFPKKGPVYRYKIKVHGNMAEFTGIEDLDGDGKADDNYYGTQRRFDPRRR